MAQRWRTRPEGSNWGDFGEHDQHGRMNLLTREIRLAAMREVKDGSVFTLSLPLDFPGGNAIVPTRSEPKFFAEPRGKSFNYNFRCEAVSPAYTDVLCDESVLLFSQYSTQWDGFSHFGQQFDADGDGYAEMVYYNGYRAGEHIIGPEQPQGPRALNLGIEHMAMAGVQGRGVLLDLKRIYGRENVKVGYDALMRAADEQRLSIGLGDFLCLYTGWADVVLEMNKHPQGDVLKSICPALDGRDQKLLQWITDSGIVAICADNLAVEAHPATPGHTHRYSMLPLHEHCLFKLGIHLGELWYFGEIASWLAAHGRSSFLLTAPPLRLTGAAGSPVTPLGTV